ncbi:DUF6479 family protein [Streptomyces sp. NPDC001922]|uniref:DUF6479 family protein n=1 Tax=Streptomyces sp. NPDC001922 TaxID=3364624 RepID=UPI0036B2CC05
MYQQLSSDIALRDYLVGIAPLVVGIIVVLLLIGAVWLGYRVRSREPDPPQQPQPRGGAWETQVEHRSGEAPPNHGPGHQDVARPRTDVSEYREGDEVPRDGVRRMPYEFGSGSRTKDDGEPRKWDHGGSGHGTG